MTTDELYRRVDQIAHEHRIHSTCSYGEKGPYWFAFCMDRSHPLYHSCLWVSEPTRRACDERIVGLVDDTLPEATAKAKRRAA